MIDRRAFFLLFAALPGGAMADVRKMGIEAAREGVAAGEVVLIDIRTPEEWAATGIAPGAVTLDMRDPAFLDRLRAMMAERPDTPHAMICASGARTGFVTGKLAEFGIDVVDVAEGMNGWLARGLPVERP